MAEKSSPEYHSFRQNYELLKSLQHGINSISDKAFAAGLISRDLRIKCSNESVTETERTRCLLNAIEDKILWVPTTLLEFVHILNDCTSFEYIGKQLLVSFEEELEVRKKEGVQPKRSFGEGKKVLTWATTPSRTAKSQNR